MLRSLKNLFRGSRGSQSRRTRQPFRPTLEVFEDRLMPSTMGLSLGHAGALVGAPAAPWLTATAVSGTQINLAWNHVAGANGYVVDEWMNGAWHELGTVGSNYTGCSIINLNPGTTYYFDVGAYNSTGTSWAYWTSATTSANTVTLTEPAAGGGYSQVNGSLFGANGPVYRDVEQGDVGDCWLLSSLAEVAARDPQDIRNMFTCKGTTVENGATVGLYSVRLFDSSGTAHYVTVDTELPDGGGLYDHPANGVLWVALAEKAYAEANGQGFVTTGSKGSDSYNALNDGDPQWALTAITGKTASDFSINPSNIAAAWNAGELIVICTSNPSSTYIVPSHCYAVVGYNPSSSQPFQVYNPWGANSSGWALGDYNGHEVYGLFTANATFISQNFAWQSFDYGAESGTDGYLQLLGTQDGTDGHVHGTHEAADLFFALQEG